MITLLTCLATAQADPPVDREVLLSREGGGDRSAFVVVLEPEGPAWLVASATDLGAAPPIRFVQSGTDEAVLKLKETGPAQVSEACAPGGDPVATVGVHRRLAKGALELAPSEPSPLEHVWVVAAAADGTWLHPATVERLEGPVLTYVLQQPVPLSAAAGAPVVDVLGRVVGVHDRVQSTEEGRQVGSACTLTSLRSVLQRP